MLTILSIKAFFFTRLDNLFQISKIHRWLYIAAGCMIAKLEWNMMIIFSLICSCSLQNFDLATMKIEDIDFTSTIELIPKSGSDTKSGLTWCHGVALWFDTGFTSRFCKEMPANLSTSPYTEKTHWSQTILTFKEPIALGSKKLDVNRSDSIGTDSCPAFMIELRISIARALEHRAIDISVETSAISHDHQKRAWPVQIFNLS